MGHKEIICENCGDNPNDQLYDCRECANQLCDNCANVCDICNDSFCDACYVDHKENCR